MIISRTKRAFAVKWKTFFLVSQVLSFKHAKQTAKNVADTTFYFNESGQLFFTAGICNYVKNSLVWNFTSVKMAKVKFKSEWKSLPKFMWTLPKSWQWTQVRFATKINFRLVSVDSITVGSCVKDFLKFWKALKMHLFKNIFIWQHLGTPTGKQKLVR